MFRGTFVSRGCGGHRLLTLLARCGGNESTKKHEMRRVPPTIPPERVQTYDQAPVSGRLCALLVRECKVEIMTSTKILIVEDQAIVAHDMRKKLEMLGYSVLGIVASGEEAIQQTAALRPDLVLMDVQLEGSMDGTEAARYIHIYFDIPIVFITAHADAETLQRIKVTEPSGYILKPFNLQELSPVIELALYKQQSEKKIREREQWLTAILHSISDAVITTDIHDHITLMNPFAEILTGWTQAEAIGRKLTDVLSIKKNIAPAEFQSGLHISENTDDHLLCRTRDGQVLTILRSAAPIRNDQGVTTGTVFVFRDITERKQAEEELQQYAHRLEILHQIDHAILNAQSLEEIAHATLSRLCHLIPYTRARVLMFDPVAQTTMVLAHSDEPIARTTSSNQRASDLGSALTSRNGCSVDTEDARASLNIPLIAHGKMIGALILASDTPHSFSAEQIRIGREVANQLAIAIQHACLLQQTQTQAAELEQRVVARTAELTIANTQLQQEIQEHRRTEQSLRESQQCIQHFAETLREQDVLLRGILDSLPEHIVVLNQQGLIIAVNAAWKQFAEENGATDPDRMDVGCNYLDICRQASWPFAEQTDKALAGIQAVLNCTMTHFTLEYSCSTPTTTHWFVMYVTSLQGEHGGAVISHINMTQQKQTEETLRISEERLKLALYALDDGLWDWDIVKDEVYFSPRWVAMLGYHPDELKCHIDVWDKLAHPDDVPQVLQALHNHLEGRTPVYVVERRLCTKSGDWIWILDQGKVVSRDANGNPTRMTGAHKNITERKNAEQALTRAFTRLEDLNERLRRSHDMVQALLEGLNDGLVLLDSAGCILTVNQSLAAMFNSTPASLVGRYWADMCYNANHTVLFPGEQALLTLRDGRARRQRERYTTPDGHAYILDVQTLPLLNADQSVDQVILHVVDVTERVHLETLQIENERFAASGKLAATVAHEVNTPLQAIQTFLYLADQDDAQQRQRYLELAGEEIERISRIVHQLLDLYRPPQKTLRSLDINALIERVLLLTGSTLTRHGIDVENDLAPDLPLFWGDPDHLTQVLLNLILNAVAAMPDGGQLRFRTRSSIDPLAPTSFLPLPEPCHTESKFVVIYISDTGCGIAPNVLSHIFEPFFTTRPDGSGLGLTISRRIIAQHGGTINVESVPGVGTTFVIVFPLHQEMLDMEIPVASWT